VGLIGLGVRVSFQIFALRMLLHFAVRGFHRGIFLYEAVYPGSYLIESHRPVSVRDLVTCTRIITNCVALSLYISGLNSLYVKRNRVIALSISAIIFYCRPHAVEQFAK